jgi:DNA-binding protein H-NS
MFKRRKPQVDALPALQRLSYDQLLTCRNEVEAEIVARGTVELDALKEKLQAIAAAQGLSIGDLLGQRKKPRKAKAAKFRNPNNLSETWTGRGKPPRWMQDKIAAGAAKEDFLNT